MLEGVALFCTVSAGMLARKYVRSYSQDNCSSNASLPTKFEGVFNLKVLVF
jgi:hypothetical protein